MLSQLTILAHPCFCYCPRGNSLMTVFTFEPQQLSVLWIVITLATRSICSQILQLPDCAQPNTAGSNLFWTVQDVWARTSLEGRAAQWDDFRDACRRITRSLHKMLIISQPSIAIRARKSGAKHE
ncbi:hypothetical protein AG1IA_09919 [Rhizoctonia solani AG-1 IA]|uniref:Uncharacterized protein n=1 Tax=Thanatephorus cucumeris (strain AG1-IA) TaxID=983506 RepID=L8WCZ1_THACA|nr:hypothetical protein AG1IA_09919 [Rhizoctonia solani AG-1 IA]